MPKFRKKPVVIDAMQYLGPVTMANRKMEDGLNYAEAFEKWIMKTKVGPQCRYVGSQLLIPTLEGIMEATPGDWIIIGVKGEVYPCKPDIFEATYEQVE